MFKFIDFEFSDLHSTIDPSSELLNFFRGYISILTLLFGSSYNLYFSVEIFYHIKNACPYLRKHAKIAF
jgi:hypothetical protein